MSVESMLQQRLIPKYIGHIDSLEETFPKVCAERCPLVENNIISRKVACFLCVSSVTGYSPRQIIHCHVAAKEKCSGK